MTLETIIRAIESEAQLLGFIDLDKVPQKELEALARATARMLNASERLRNQTRARHGAVNKDHARPGYVAGTANR